MSNRTYVCFDCRTTERLPTSRIAKKCRKCRKPAQHVYYKFRIPARGDAKAWADLEARVRPMNLEMQTRALKRLRARRARLERLVATVRSDVTRRAHLRQLRQVNLETQAWLTWSVT